MWIIRDKESEQKEKKICFAGNYKIPNAADFGHTKIKSLFTDPYLMKF